MIDVQNQPDARRIPIDKVGVKDIRYPVIVRDKARDTQATVASISMYVNLPEDFKGTHMSRFIEVLNRRHGRITLNNFLGILDELKTELNALSALVEMEFPYFIEKSAPVSGAKSLMEYNCRYIGEINHQSKLFHVGITVPVTTLCPCSREMSDRGAHNQRGRVTVTLEFKGFFWIEDVIALIEGSASSPVYALLKREDEKWVTEHSYDHPMFVEDLVREVTRRLRDDPNFTWFRVEAENFESIHNHSAYAMVEWKRKQE
ncbi:MAG TPA: GTP cyclohydrolase FolE2 [bacterium]|nr:GTP cyclohydrolase FolE2 [bacterium]